MWRKLSLTAVLLAVLGGTAGQTAQAHKESYRALAWQIILKTFPASTRAAAFRVANCETVGFTDFLNASGAADLFQEMPGNDGRVFTYNGHSMKLHYGWLRARDEGPPTMYAAKIAYLQSQGGYNWSEWICQP